MPSLLRPGQAMVRTCRSLLHGATRTAPQGSHGLYATFAEISASCIGPGAAVALPESLRRLKPLKALITVAPCIQACWSHDKLPPLQHNKTHSCPAPLALKASLVFGREIRGRRPCKAFAGIARPIDVGANCSEVPMDLWCAPKFVAPAVLLHTD